jgi:hypothetical protein
MSLGAAIPYATPKRKKVARGQLLLNGLWTAHEVVNQGWHRMAQHMAQVPPKRAVWRIQDERLWPRAWRRGTGELHAIQDNLGTPCLDVAPWQVEKQFPHERLENQQ